MNNRNAKLILLFLGGGSLFLLLALAAAWIILGSLFGPSGFDQSVWLAWYSSSEPDNPRYGMVDDLQTMLLQDRPTRVEVLELLGTPDGGQGDDYLGYNLGASFVGVDFDALVIYFDENDRVFEVRIVQG